MRTTRRRRPTEADLSALRDCHRTMSALAAHLHPATPEYRSLALGVDAVRTVGIDWTGNPDLWRGSDCQSRENRTDFLVRPSHPRWPK